MKITLRTFKYLDDMSFAMRMLVFQSFHPGNTQTEGTARVNVFEYSKKKLGIDREEYRC